MSAARGSGSYAILRNRDFRALLTGRVCLNFALELQAVVVGWQVYSIKKDPLYLGLIGLAEAVPALSLALFGGHVVDHGEPLRIYRRMVGLAFASSLALLGVAAGWFGGDAHLQLTVIFGVIFLSGVIRAFAWPALFAITPRIIERDMFAVAQTWMSSGFQAATICGPAVGGLLYAWKGPSAAYGVTAIMILATLLVTLAMRLAPRERAPGAVREPVAKSLSAGVRFVFSNQVVLGALSLDMFAVLFGGDTALLPIFASDILKSGPQSLGLLRAAPAVGALAMNAVMIHRPIGRRAGRRLLLAVGGFGLSMIFFGLSRSLWLSVALLGISGALDAVSVVVRHTILQLWTPDEMRGRVSAVNMIFIGSSNEIGGFESGVAARLLGTVPSVVFGGCMTLLVVATAAVKAPLLRGLEFDRPVRK